MAKPNHLTINYPSTHYVESAGAVQFVLPVAPETEAKVVVIHYSTRDAYLLAKGRRNIKEARAIAAVRETQEETGLASKLVPIRLHSRAPPEIEETAYTEDVVRTFDNVTEPFMLMTRFIKDAQIKLIWWYIAIVDEAQPEGLKPEPGLTPKAMGFAEALEALKYECDREVLRQAIKVFQENFPQTK